MKNVTVSFRKPKQFRRGKGIDDAKIAGYIVSVITNSSVQESEIGPNRRKFDFQVEDDATFTVTVSTLLTNGLLSEPSKAVTGNIEEFPDPPTNVTFTVAE